MKHTKVIVCTRCGCDDLQKNGHSPNGTQRWVCKGCRKFFQLQFIQNGRLQSVKDKVVEMSMNGSGIRDISRVLKISTTTVINTIKKTPAEINPYLLDLAEQNMLDELDVHISYEVETDEFWSFVGSKKNRRWTWYAIERKSGVVVAWHNGLRGNKSLEALLEKMNLFPIRSYSTDDRESYTSLLPANKHYIGKDRTWKIERKNLNFRTHLKRLCRKTICFSKSIEMHDKLIGLYIEKHYYKTGLYQNASQLI